MSRSLDLLRASTAFRDVIEDTTALQPFAHLLRDMLDTRPRSEKIRDSIERMAAGLGRHHDERTRTSAVRERIERWLPLLPLAGVPCDPVIRNAMRNAERKTKLCAEVSPAQSRPGHAGVIDPST